MRTRTIGLVGTAVAVMLTLALLPALVSPAVTPAISQCAAPDSSIGVIAATIRQLESGNDYTARAGGSTASGAYQFLDSTWAAYNGYPRAWLAPPSVQDAKAAEHITGILASHDHDVTAVPVVWYLGHLPPPSSTRWDTIPAPGAGNRLTPRQYQDRWMNLYRTKLAEHEDPGTDETPSGADDGPHAACIGGRGEVVADGWALPGPRSLLDATADQLDDPHHDYPAWDWSIPTGTPIYAIRGGTVISTTTNAHNCYRQANCQKCGLGVIIRDDLDATWTYCHGSQIHVDTGRAVTAGQQVLTSGNSGNSSGPHLHLGLEAHGERRCPQPALIALHRSGSAPHPHLLPTSGCSY